MAAVVLLSLGRCAWAGKLSDFEKAATEERTGENKKAPKSDDSDDSFFSGLLSDILEAVFVNGGEASLYRMQPDPPGVTAPFLVEPRRPGDVLLPTVSADVVFQNVRSDVIALDARFEAGYGPAGLQYRLSRY